jgi:hypothetical protein
MNKEQLKQIIREQVRQELDEQIDPLSFGLGVGATLLAPDVIRLIMWTTKKTVTKVLDYYSKKTDKREADEGEARRAQIKAILKTLPGQLQANPEIKNAIDAYKQIKKDKLKSKERETIERAIRDGLPSELRTRQLVNSIFNATMNEFSK